jgi:hypothetical protein
MSMLEPEEIDEFENDELLLLLSSSISSNVCLVALKKRTPSSRRHLVNFVFATKNTFRYI